MAAGDYERMSDEDLMGAFYACDGMAFEALAARRRAALEAYFRRRGCSADLAEELADDALVRLFNTKY